MRIGNHIESISFFTSTKCFLNGRPDSKSSPTNGRGMVKSQLHVVIPRQVFLTCDSFIGLLSLLDGFFFHLFACSGCSFIRFDLFCHSFFHWFMHWDIGTSLSKSHFLSCGRHLPLLQPHRPGAVLNEYRGHSNSQHHFHSVLGGKPWPNSTKLSAQICSSFWTLTLKCYQFRFCVLREHK